MKLPPHGAHRPRVSSFAIALAGVFAATPMEAQVSASERATFTQTISGTEITIDYARPSMRDRDSIFGDEVHWEEVWTPGANDATTLAVSKEVTLNGHTLAPGKYSVWMQVLPGDEWILMLHEDTTMFHIPHPKVEDGFLSFPIAVTRTADVYETLAFDIQRVRATGGQIVMQWANTRAVIDLGIDPGFDMTVEADDAARYVGAWTRQMVPPPDSVLAMWKEGMTEEDLAELDAWFAPTETEIVYDAEAAHLYVFDREGMDADDLPDVMLLPKADGLFIVGWLWDGELAFAGEDSYIEFEFDDRNTAQAYVILSSGDEVQGKGTRTN